MDTEKEKKQNNGTADDPEEKSYETFFAIGATADDNQQKSEVKLLQQIGFQIATLPQVDIYDRLEREVQSLVESAASTEEAWQGLYDTVIVDLQRKITLTEEDISEIRNKKEHEEAIGELKNKKLVIEVDIEKLKEGLIKVREILAGSKKGIGEKLVGDVEAELMKVAQLQKTIYNETKFINEDRHRNTKDVLTTYIQKLRDLRASYHLRFELLDQKIRALGADGINPGIARLLITLGTATAGAAGYFFAIFSAKSNYSSQDALYYLLKNVLESTNKSTTPFLIKLAYLLAGLALVTGFSWVIDLLLKKKTFYSQKNSEQDSYNFSSAFKVEGISYEQKNQSKTWLLLWLRVVPIALVIGMAIIVLSKESSVVGDTNLLSASTEGLLIGTVLAMGFSAIVYIYITKNVETRTAAKGMAGMIRDNWELVTAVSFFILVVTAFMFYRDNGLTGQFPASPYSMVGFLGSCITTAFAFGYGIRYLGLHQSLSQIEYQINSLDVEIAYHSGPKQIILDVNYSKNLDDLMGCLIDNLNRKGELLKTTSQKDAPARLSEHSEGNVYKRIITMWKPGASKNNFGEAELFEILEWEIEYFPEYAEQLKILGSVFKDKKRQLAEAESAILKHTEEMQKASEKAKTDIGVLRKKVDTLNAVGASAKKYYIECKTLRTEATNKNIVHIRDGFNLGLWYRKHQMGDEI